MSDNNQQEQDFFADEQEIEISDLPEDKKRRNTRERFASNIRKISLIARYTPEQRKRRVVITGSIILVTLIFFVVSVFPVQTLFAQLMSSKLVASGDDLFYFPELPSWGTFMLDGKPLKSAPMTDSGPPLELSRGKHTLEWRGEPFTPLQCTLFVPPAPDQQTCKTRSSGSNEYTKNAWIIDFPLNLSLQQLPENERAALISTVQNLLNGLTASEIVQPGERYSYQQNGLVYEAATKQPLQATQRFVLDTNISEPPDCRGPRFGAGCSSGDSDCRLLCTLNWPTRAGDPSMLGWHVAAVVNQHWTYVPVSKQANLSTIDRRGDQHLITLQIIRERHQWRAIFHPQGASPFDDPNCIGLVGQITSSDVYRRLEETQQRMTWTYSSGSNRASGCLATGTIGGVVLHAPATHGRKVYLLYRFNQLQAVDPLAQRFWPSLPRADKHAQDVAMLIANNAVFVS